MEDPRYRKEPRPAVLNQRRKPLRKEYSIVLRSALIVMALLLVAMGWMLRHARQPLPQQKPPPARVIPPEIVNRLAETRVETAQAKLEQGKPDEALALLASALTAGPAAEDARALAEEILRGNVWHFPALAIRHPLAVEHLVFRGGSSLWVGLSGETSTVVKWDAGKHRIESVLFPVGETAIRSLVVDQTGKRMVVERAGFLLLCDAQTLKPVMDLGVLPDDVTPDSAVVFSSDGLLLGHPAVAGGGKGLVWRIRDAVSGQILRSHEALANGGSELPRPLTAFLDRVALRVVHADGGLLEIPVSPVEPSKHIAEAAQVLLHAQFIPDGSAWLGLVDRGPHEPQQLVLLPAGGMNMVASALAAMIGRFPWSRQPGIWNGLLRDHAISPLRVESHAVIARDGMHAPIRTASEVTAVARHGRMVMIGAADGTLSGYRLLPKPVEDAAQNAFVAVPDEAAAAAFLHLTTALCGLRHHEDERRFATVPALERQQAAAACDVAKLRQLFPSLDFQPVLEELTTIVVHEATADEMQPLTGRLARADPKGEGSPAVVALALALDSSLPGTIADCLAAVENPPPLLRKLAESRIAWLEGRKAEAFNGWPDEFPDLQKIRLREDWAGWEQTDFVPALEAFRQLMESELARLAMPADATPEQRRELFERLTDPETARTFGRLRVGRAALQAAQAFATFADDAEATLALAVLAGNFGAEPAAAMRAEANALAALGRHDKAHERWITLITEQPLDSHQPSDYAEAAYTAFETAEPLQAMEILTTAIQRFPNDPEFALRAGWIALLTGHADHAYRFLLTGRQAGFPPSTHERAAALLAIAAAQCGEAYEAGEFYQELVELNPAWEDPAAIEDLDWPEELKASLRQLTW